MIKSLTVALALAVVSGLLVASNRADVDEGKSPEEVFKSYSTAVKKDDVKAMMSHITRDSQLVAAGSMWFGASLGKSLKGITVFRSKPTPKEQEEIAAIEEVLKRHDLSDDVMLKKLEEVGKEATDEERFAAIGKLVKDKPAFIKEILMAMDAGPASTSEVGDAKVKEVKIEGPKARGRATFSGADGKEKTATIYFELESGVWKIDLVETNCNWPQPPPPPQSQPPATQIQPPPAYYESRPALLRCLCPCLRRR